MSRGATSGFRREVAPRFVQPGGGLTVLLVEPCPYRGVVWVGGWLVSRCASLPDVGAFPGVVFEAEGKGAASTP